MRLGRGDGRIHSLEDLLSKLQVCQQLKALWVQRMSDMLSFPTLPTVYGTFAPTAIRFKVDKLVKIGAIETKYCPN